MSKPTLTTTAGAPIADNQNSASAGERGPLLMQDYQLLEKLAHQNRERIPERTVHAKGWGAHGTLTITHDITKYSKAKIFSKVGKKTELFARFTTVAGERGAADHSASHIGPEYLRSVQIHHRPIIAEHFEQQFRRAGRDRRDRGRVWRRPGGAEMLRHKMPAFRSKAEGRRSGRHDPRAEDARSTAQHIQREHRGIGLAGNLAGFEGERLAAPVEFDFVVVEIDGWHFLERLSILRMSGNAGRSHPRPHPA